jgi:hypothetical protein
METDVMIVMREETTSVTMLMTDVNVVDTARL